MYLHDLLAVSEIDRSASIGSHSFSDAKSVRVQRAESRVIARLLVRWATVPPPTVPDAHTFISRNHIFSLYFICLTAYANCCCSVQLTSLRDRRSRSHSQSHRTIFHAAEHRGDWRDQPNLKQKVITLANNAVYSAREEWEECERSPPQPLAHLHAQCVASPIDPQ